MGWIFKVPLLIILVVMAGPIPAEARERITFWTTEVEKERLETQAEIARDFSRRTGLGLQVVPVQENLLAERITAAYAARSLPDVVLHPAEFSAGWAEAGMLDTPSARLVIQTLGVETFGEGPLRMVEAAGGYAAIPLDGWGQLLLYRKDLFEAKGLPPPASWDRILEAAQALHAPPDLWGFEAATAPKETYTQQVFEHFALSNAVRLAGPSGGVSLDTPAMIQTLEFYRRLTRFSPPGNLSWLHTRMDYLSGRAAMILWSPFILDELSGLRDDQPVIPDIETGQPGFLARNTGFVAVIRGPQGEGAQYGQTNYLGITKDANRPAAGRWAKFLLNEGYLKWLGMAAEGKVPVRRGTPEKPQLFREGWMDLEFGGARRARISQFYGKDLAGVLLAGQESYDRWGLAAGKGALVARIYTTKVVPEILKRFLDGELDARQAAQQMDRRVKALQ